MQLVKKSAVDLTDLAIGIIVLGVVVTIGAVILTGVRDARLTDLSVVSVGNETITPSAGVGVKVTNRWVESFTIVTNKTGGETIATTNYTTSISATDGTGKVTIVANSPYNLTDLNVTYRYYNTSRADWAVANNATIGIGEYGNWFKIIVIVGVASLVLGLIFMAFGKNSSSGSSTTY